MLVTAESHPRAMSSAGRLITNRRLHETPSRSAMHCRR